MFGGCSDIDILINEQNNSQLMSSAPTNIHFHPVELDNI